MTIEQLKRHCEHTIAKYNMWKAVHGSCNETAYEEHKLILELIEKVESHEDCISRKAVLDIIRFEDKWLTDAKSNNADTDIAFSGIKSKVTGLPPIQPKAKVGKWIRWHEEITTDNGVIEYKPHCKCSECNKEYDSYSTRFMNYCLNCGAEMQEVEE